MPKIKNVLLVCMGNTARSPVAEYLAKYYAHKYNLEVQFDSCGFFNAFTYMQPESQVFLDSKKIDHSDFRPKLLTKSLLEKQDLILTMEKAQSLDIIKNYFQVEGIDKKTFTLKQFNGAIRDINIIDPYYTSYKAYQKVLKTIDENIEKMVRKIININKYNKTSLTI